MKHSEPSENLKRYIEAYRAHSSHVELESVQAVLKNRLASPRNNWYHSHLTAIITSSCIVGAAVLSYFLLSTPTTPSKKPANTLSETISKHLQDTNAKFVPLPEPLFGLTKRAYDVRANLDSAVRAEFGPGHSIADWNDLTRFCASHPVDSLIAMVGWPLSVASAHPDSVGENVKDQTVNFFINYNGNRFWVNHDPTWRFFATRWDHHPPSNWLIVDSIDGNHLVLGAWADMKCRILVKNKNFH